MRKPDAAMSLVRASASGAELLALGATTTGGAGRSARAVALRQPAPALTLAIKAIAHHDATRVIC
jgi:hypothetical protein